MEIEEHRAEELEGLGTLPYTRRKFVNATEEVRVTRCSWNWFSDLPLDTPDKRSKIREKTE
ncbi:hypothetical protein E2C01_055481 [Portunus trituberculatus]|uniref:Uncharacterized protein n=1 Tax=Portunus trituberculatus TaxID=210409 RepID=A0A5B7GV44_PORTR|nr:hypothetical protein [Portunus trituberculatus]